MPKKYLFFALLTLLLASGCSLEKQPAPNVAEAPPYWLSQRERSQSQLTELRAFHEKESAEMSEDVHVFRNHEMERLAAAGKELEAESRQQAHQKKQPEQQDKGIFSFFKKKRKDDTEDAPSVSRTGGEVQNVR